MDGRMGGALGWCGLEELARDPGLRNFFFALCFLFSGSCVYAWSSCV